jgi:hypothetical protein
LRRLGNVADAHRLMVEILPQFLDFNEPESLMTITEDYALMLIDLGEHELAVTLIAAADAMRKRHGSPMFATQEADTTKSIAAARLALSPSQWDQVWLTGGKKSVSDALSEALADHPRT